jgi:hypothetical protein
VSRDERRLRAELEWLRAKYDSGAVSDAVFAVTKSIETEISWREHAQQESRRV